MKKPKSGAINLLNINASQSEKLPGKIGKYQVVEKLGKGGMGCVYKVFDPELEMFFALKVLLKNQENYAQRFTREAKAMAKMDHPNIVKIYNVGQDNSYIFFTMEYIEGISLREYLANTKLNIRLFSQIMLEIARSMFYAHKRGVIHRVEITHIPKVK